MSARGAERLLQRAAQRPLTARRAGQIIALFTIATTVVSGVLIHFVDRQDFPNVWLGLWWAVQTVTTVGYGDVTPAEPAGRAIAAFVMVSGLGFLTVVTASITALFIESARGRLAGRPGDPIVESLERLDQRLTRIESTLRERGLPPDPPDSS